MGFFEKVKWILGILMVFFLILTTNLIDKNNFLRVKESVSSIYADRLLAFDLIFEIANSVHEKELNITGVDPSLYLEKNSSLNVTIGEYVRGFRQTKLTVAESNAFNDLTVNLEALKLAENRFAQSGFTDKKDLDEAMNRVKNSLHELAEIQLIEGRRQVHISQNAVDTVELFTHLEIYVLIFLAILIQVVVMYKPKKS